MLLSIAGKLASERIVLASSSPRRSQILENINFPFEVIPSLFDESIVNRTDFKETQDYVQKVALCKAFAVADQLELKESLPDLIIAADTAVSLNGHIYGKPTDEEDAFNMLSKLSNTTHTVYTGVVIIKYSPPDHSRVLKSFYESTDVEFAELSDLLITDYIKTKEPMDKAGGYGFQALGGTFLKAIHGDYYNVIGFPLHHFCKALLELYV